jgi:phosphatidylserine/phosphatidylglycerophosphate/cardiolipin synthase-like enzyme
MQNEVIIGKEFPDKVKPLIENAKNSIKIIVFDWRWYVNDPGNAVQLFNQTIVRASRRGVKIEAIVNHTDILTPLKENGIQAKKLNITGLVHAKLMIIDDNIVILGSHNYTHNAFVINHEISIILKECNVVKDFNLFFTSLWS